jgi:YVTN family beta-propeller protein
VADEGLDDNAIRNLSETHKQGTARAWHCLAAVLGMLALGQPGEAQKILATVPVVPYGQAIAVNSKTHKLYVVSEPSNELIEIDGETFEKTVISLGPTSEKSLDGAICIDPARNTIYVTNVVNSTVAVIDGVTHAVKFVPVGTHPTALEINAITHKIYVANTDSNNITVIDGRTLKSKTISVGLYPSGIAVNARTNTVYVTNAHSNNVSIIYGTKNKIRTVEAGNNPYPVAVNQATNRAFIGNLGGDSVTIITGRSRKVRTVKVSPHPFWIAVNESTNKIYMTHQAAHSVTVIDGQTNAVSTIGTDINATGAPNGLAVDELRNKIYIAEWATRVTAIDGTTGATHALENPGYNTYKIIANPHANEFYTLNMTTNANNPYPPSSVTLFAGQK